MSQKAALAALDEHIHASLASAGLADAAQYTPPATGATAVPCSVYVDRGVQDVGELGQLKGLRVEVAYVLSSMAPVAPADDGVLVVDGDTYINVYEIGNDGSLSRWVVRRGG